MRGKVDSLSNYPLPYEVYEAKANRRYKCEHPGCRRGATTEWSHADEEGETYYTMRCDKHPANAPYTARAL